MVASRVSVVAKLLMYHRHLTVTTIQDGREGGEQSSVEGGGGGYYDKMHATVTRRLWYFKVVKVFF